MSPDREILLRGEAARRARPIDLAAPSSTRAELAPVGPWAGENNDSAEAARRKGYAQGLLEGREVGRQAGIDELDRRNTEMAAAVRHLVDRHEREAEELGKHLASEVAELALEIAAAILDREVRVAVDPGAEAIARCLDIAPMLGDLVAQLHPEDAKRLGTIAELAERQLTVVADPGLQPGDAIVTIDDTTIDGRLSEALDRVREVLR